MTHTLHQRTIGIIPPAAIRSGAYAPILEQLQQSGLTLTLVLRRTLTKTEVVSICRDRPQGSALQPFLEFMTDGPSLLLILEGSNAIQRAQDLTGCRLDSPAPAESIRGQFTMSEQPLHYVLYVSTSPAAALHEYQVLFQNTDLSHLKASA